MSKAIENNTIDINNMSDTDARVGSAGYDKILARLIEMPTKIKPVSAAAAQAVAT